MLQANEITTGMKLNLNVNGKARIYEVKLIKDGKYKLTNKFFVGFFVGIDFINAHLITE